MKLALGLAPVYQPCLSAPATGIVVCAPAMKMDQSHSAVAAAVFVVVVVGMLISLMSMSTQWLEAEVEQWRWQNCGKEDRGERDAVDLVGPVQSRTAQRTGLPLSDRYFFLARSIPVVSVINRTAILTFSVVQTPISEQRRAFSLNPQSLFFSFIPFACTKTTIEQNP